LLEGKLVVNPSFTQQKTSLLNIVVAGSDEAIVMVEAGALEVSEDTVAEALAFGHEQVKRIITAIRELHARLAPKKVVVPPLAFDEELAAQIESSTASVCTTRSTPPSIQRRRAYSRVGAIHKEILEAIPADQLDRRKACLARLRAPAREIFPRRHLNRKRRPDGRAFDQIRQITCEVGLLPRVHGSALFTRGETQALATLTLGTKEDMQRLDLLFEEDSFRRFMLHYNFPRFPSAK